MKRASWVARFLAFLIDLLFLLAVSILLLVSGALGAFIGAGAGKASVSGLLATLAVFAFVFFFFEIFLFLFYFTYLTAHDENTFGKGVFGLKVVCRENYAPCGVVRSLARTLAYWLSALPLFLGFLMALIPGGLALHDIVAGTMVVKEE
jgi:uncharacterized RDD family membrane protein YckC